jgi:hypothetical protein
MMVSFRKSNMQPLTSNTPPAWLDEKSVQIFVDEELKGGGRYEVYGEYQRNIHEGIFGYGPPFEEILSEALAEAKAGDPEQLADLLRPRSPHNQSDTPIYFELTPEVRNFLADLADGSRNPLTGKFAGEPGRPSKLSQASMNKRRILRRAEREFRAIRAILQRYYKKHGRNAIRGRALSLAATRNAASEGELDEFINRPKKRK